jgi:hypothetical protein
MNYKLKRFNQNKGACPLVNSFTRLLVYPFTRLLVYLFTCLLFLCAGCLDTTDNWNVSDEDNLLNTTNDKMHSVVGVLKYMQAAIERSIIVGELRGELTDITSLTEGDLQAIANYTATGDNPYCSPQVFYSVINNANFFIARADTSVREIIDGVLQPVLLQDYVVMKTFRAWAYLQLGLMYGKASYFTEPLLTLDAIERYSKDPQYHYDLPTLLYALYEDLLATPDVDYPDYGAMGGHADFRDLCISRDMLLGEICLNLGTYNNPYAYEMACYYYVNAMARNKTGVRYPNGGMTYVQRSGSSDITVERWMASHWQDKYCTNWSAYYMGLFSGLSSDEILTGVQYSDADGGSLNLLNMTQVPINSSSILTYQMAPSPAAMDMFDNEVYTYYDPVNKEFTYHRGDLRGYIPRLNYFYFTQVDGSINLLAAGLGSYTYSASTTADSLPVISKYAASFGIGSSDTYITAYLYRRSTVWLRFAEALNWSGRPSAAFAILKHSLNNAVLTDSTKVNQQEVTPMPSYLQVFTDSRYDNYIFGGIHSRGSGDTYNDTLHYAFNDVTLQDNRDLGYYGFPERLATLEDSIRFVDAMICKELALETAFEGNRYTDLLRFAERRSQLFGDDNFLAKWLGRKNPELESRLRSKNNWRLPLN